MLYKSDYQRQQQKRRARLETAAFILLGIALIGCGYALLYIMAVTGPWR
mgnify:CR=1 FL=1